VQRSILARGFIPVVSERCHQALRSRSRDRRKRDRSTPVHHVRATAPGVNFQIGLYGDLRRHAANDTIRTKREDLVDRYLVIVINQNLFPLTCDQHQRLPLVEFMEIYCVVTFRYFAVVSLTFTSKRDVAEARARHHRDNDSYREVITNADGRKVHRCEEPLSARRHGSAKKRLQR
jgi:hypothetical protein